MTPKTEAPQSSPHRRSAAIFLSLCALFLSAAVAQQPISLAEADQRIGAVFQQSATTGMVLVVVRNREVLIKT